ncbi:MAG: dipeptide epimerase [Acidobacteriota bacterium]|nr:MAG: dipeptide epimerase [Acidobacteriota bacterium]
MNYRTRTERLRTRHPFGISRSTEQEFAFAFLEIPAGVHVGLGEAAPASYYGGETEETALAFFERLRGVELEDEFSPAEFMRPLREATEFDGAAKAAVDMALWDLWGKRSGEPVFEGLGLPPPRPKATSFTVGIDSPEAMERKVLEAKDYPVLKVKVGTPNDEENLQRVRARHKGALRVDANAAWSPEEAPRRIERLARFDLELVEQPIDPKEGREGWRYVKDRVAVPLVADESARVASDLAALEGVADGVNIKLMKCGGLSAARRMAREAKKRGLKVMLGCMIETSLAITAAFHLSSLADWLDLDGHLLLADDPFEGVREAGPGVLAMPLGGVAGLGVSARR